MAQELSSLPISAIKLIPMKQLVVMLQANKQFILIDCRSFMEFHTSNIQTSINIGGNRLVRRRLLQGKVTAFELLEKKLETSVSWPYLQPSSVSVVVYDQCTDDLSGMRPECFALVIMQQLKAYYSDVYLLKGGFLGFQAVYPHHCWENKGKMEDEDFVVAPAGADPGGDCCINTSNAAAIDTAMVRAAVDQTRRSGRGGGGGLTRGSGGLTPELTNRGYPEFPLSNPSAAEGTPPSPASAGVVGGGMEHSSASPSGNTKWHPLSGPALPVTNPGPTEILQHVILGCQADAMSGAVLRSHGITHVINVSVDVPTSPHVNRRHFLRIPINDNYSDRILPHLHRAFDFLNEARDAKGRALVHCSAGISRSPTVAIAYLMNHCHLSMKEAYDYVKSARPSVSPNFNFLGQLLELERQLQANHHYQNHHHSNLSQTVSTAITPATLMRDSGHPVPTRVIAGTLRTGSGSTGGSGNIITTGKYHTRRSGDSRPLKLLYSFSGNRNSVGGVPLSREDALFKQHQQHQRQLLPSPSDELRSLADLIVTSSTSSSTAVHHHRSRPSMMASVGLSGSGSTGVVGGRGGTSALRPTRSRSPLTTTARQSTASSSPSTPPAITATVSNETVDNDPLSRFPTTSLDQLHFQPCSTARPALLKGLSATFPRYQPPGTGCGSGVTQCNSLPPPGQQTKKRGTATGCMRTSPSPLTSLCTANTSSTSSGIHSSSTM